MNPHVTRANYLIDTTVIALTYVILLISLYSSAFDMLFRLWQKDDYSYCYVIPFIVIYLIFEKRNEFFQRPFMHDWRGLAVIAVGVFAYWLGELGGEFYIIYFSFWLTIVGLLLLHQGKYRISSIIFPLGFILTMFPLPSFFNSKITLALKILSSKLGVIFMQLSGMSAYREGNVIELGFTTLQVVDACSGLRYLYPMVVLSIVVAYFYKAQWWKKAIVVFSSVPLTIGSNAVRIALTGILAKRFGMEAIDGFFHDFEGWLIFMVVLGFLLGEMWILEKVFKQTVAVGNYGENPLQKNIQKQDNIISKREILKPHFLVTACLLLLSTLLIGGVDFREEIPLRKPFSVFPAKIGEWEGVQQRLEPEIIDELDFSDYVMLDYADEKKKLINFYVAYYESQRKGESIHSPASCLRGGGWEFKQAGRTKISLLNGNEIHVNRAVLEKEPVKQISYYWFPFRGRILTNAYEMKVYNFWDALTRQRTDGALVRLITPVYPDETEASAEDRLRVFLSEVKPVISNFLPN